MAGVRSPAWIEDHAWGCSCSPNWSPGTTSVPKLGPGRWPCRQCVLPGPCPQLDGGLLALELHHARVWVHHQLLRLERAADRDRSLCTRGERQGAARVAIGLVLPASTREALAARRCDLDPHSPGAHVLAPGPGFPPARGARLLGIAHQVLGNDDLVEPLARAGVERGGVGRVLSHDRQIVLEQGVVAAVAIRL